MNTRNCRPRSPPPHTLLPGLAGGRYRIGCRTFDANGIAQPMPRPFLKPGHNALLKKTLVVEG